MQTHKQADFDFQKLQQLSRKDFSTNSQLNLGNTTLY